MTFHLAPPFLSRTGPDGRPKKRTFGAGWRPLLTLLARAKRLRGTWADPFARQADRRLERALITQFEADMHEWLPQAAPQTHDKILALARLPQDIRGFGPVKAEAARQAALTREALLWELRDATMPDIAAQ